MKILNAMTAAALALASTAAGATVSVSPAKQAASKVSTCYYQFSFIAADGVYDVYTCYGNGDGSY